MASANDNVQRRPGRPRSSEAEAAIVEATQEALARDGYSRMSVDAIAADAGVSKATIYRRWPSKEDLATAAISALQVQSPPAARESTRDDLTSQLDHFRSGVERPLGMAMIGTLLAEEPHNPELLGLFRERIVNTRRSWLCRALQDGIERGDLRETIDVELVASMLIGTYYGGYLAGQRTPDNWSEQVVDLILSGIAATR